MIALLLAGPILLALVLIAIVFAHRFFGER